MIEQNGSQAERIELLSLVEELEPLSTEEIGRLAQRTIERSFREGDTVYVPGNASEVVYLLLLGRIRLYGMAGGQELTFEIIRAGTMFGVASLMERTQDEYAVALEPSRVGLLDLNDFWPLVQQNLEVYARVVKLLGDSLRSSRSRMKDIALKEVPARLASLILDLVQGEGVVTREGHYKVPARYTHEQLATMIGSHDDRDETRGRDQGFRKAAGRRVRAALETSNLCGRLGGFETVGCGELNSEAYCYPARRIRRRSIHRAAEKGSSRKSSFLC